jgi:hypothetical protein
MWALVEQMRLASEEFSQKGTVSGLPVLLTEKGCEEEHVKRLHALMKDYCESVIPGLPCTHILIE